MGRKAKKKLAHLVGEKPSKKPKRPGKWQRHEAMVAATLLAENFDYYVAEAAAVKASPTLKLRADKISDLLFQLCERLATESAKRSKK